MKVKAIRKIRKGRKWSKGRFVKYLANQLSLDNLKILKKSPTAITQSGKFCAIMEELASRRIKLTKVGNLKRSH